MGHEASSFILWSLSLATEVEYFKGRGPGQRFSLQCLIVASFSLESPSLRELLSCVDWQLGRDPLGLALVAQPE